MVRQAVTNLLLLGVALWALTACEYGQVEEEDTDADSPPGPTHPISSLPRMYATDVPVNPNVRVRFNRHLDANSVSPDAMSLSSGPINKWLMTYYDPLMKQILAWPSVPLRANVDWVFRLEEGLRDMDGNEISPVEITRFTSGEVMSDARPFQDRTYAEDVAPIFDTHCAGCHGGANGFAGLDLSSEEGLRDTVINVESGQWQGWRRVDPYFPGRSYLLFKIINNDMTSGARMPRAAELEGEGTPLSLEEQRVVTDWIAGGALF